MRPRSGFELARHVQTEGRKTALVMVADNPTTNLLVESGKYDIKQVMGTPVEPLRLIETVRRVLRAQNRIGHIPLRPAPQSPQELMRRAIVLAQQNARSGMGGPFGAVVADAQGNILGEGVNSVKTRSDPTAQAEVLAIRRATEVLNRTDLTGCVVYCSAEPAMLGEALIISTGISRVVYALTHEEVGMTRAVEAQIRDEMAKPPAARAVPHEQAGHDEALAMYRAAQEARAKG
jgi:tRNA(Arg) A34 adenosine deaminase TadA